MRVNKVHRFVLLLGILFAVILIGYSIAPIEGFLIGKRTNAQLDMNRGQTQDTSVTQSS